MKIDGRCHCGTITYEAEVDPAGVTVCHCTDCQTLSGSAFRTVVPAAKADFTLRTGHPKIYVKTAESGAKRAQAFCPDCGTPIYSAAAGDAPMLFIRVGTSRQRAQLPPKSQVWFRSALDWVTDLSSVPRSARQESLAPAGRPID
jgi:hypothetical protein